MKKLTKLPEKWYIRLTKTNQKVVIDVVNKSSKSDRKGVIGFEYGNIGKIITCIYDPLSRTEIFFNDFKRLVLKERPKPIKKKQEIKYKVGDKVKCIATEGFKADSDTNFTIKGGIKINKIYTISHLGVYSGNEKEVKFEENKEYYYPLSNFVKATSQEIKNYLNNTMKKREIIGYKLKTRFDNAKIKNNSIFGKHFDFKNFEKTATSEYTVFTEELKNLGLLDIWFEPVYKSKDIYIGTENNGYKVEKKEAWVTINGENYSKRDIANVKAVLLLPNIKSINCGCSSQFQINLQKIEEISELLNKK